METIEIKDPPFLIGETSIAKIEVVESSFQVLLGATGKAKAAAGGTVGDDFRKRVYRERIKAQAAFRTAEGKAISVNDETLLQLPIVYAKTLYNAIDIEAAQPGEIIQDGDGVTTPIIYRLGKPIAVKGKGEIVELEFMAKTLGDIESVLAGQSDFEQALSLIQSVARPLGSDAQLLALPTWAVAQITVPDGVTIAQKILPSFLG